MGTGAPRIDDLAALCARIDDPFADRGHVLASEGLDEARFRSLMDAYLELLATPDEQASARAADHFSATYARIRDHLSASRRAARAVAPTESLGSTAPLVVRCEPVLPFRDEPADAVKARLPLPMRGIPREQPRPSLTETADMKPVTPAELPFAAPPAPSKAGNERPHSQSAASPPGGLRRPGTSNP